MTVQVFLLVLLLCVTTLLSIGAGFCIGWILAGRSVARSWLSHRDEASDAGS
jgi:hypothetical protein